MNNTSYNLRVIKQIASALEELNEKVIYVGGATVSLYVNDEGADDVRPTKDVDISLKIVSLDHLESTREQLISKGFTQSANLDVICRFLYNDILVDVMSTKPIGWAPANVWFSEGFERSEIINMEDISIRIMPLPYFVASKFAAFNDRGRKDPRTSHDLEDITYILNNRTDWDLEFNNSDMKVKNYLLEQVQEIISNSQIQEAIMANLEYGTQEERYNLILKKINNFMHNSNQSRFN